MLFLLLTTLVHGGEAPVLLLGPRGCAEAAMVVGGKDGLFCPEQCCRNLNRSAN